MNMTQFENAWNKVGTEWVSIVLQSGEEILAKDYEYDDNTIYLIDGINDDGEPVKSIFPEDVEEVNPFY